MYKSDHSPLSLEATPSPPSQRMTTTTTTTTAPKQPPSKLPVILRMPNTGFGISMGFAGNAILWKNISMTSFFFEHIGYIKDADAPNFMFWIMSLIVAIIVGSAYLYKIVTNYELVRDEIKNAERVHFLNAPHLIIMMLAIGAPNDWVTNPSENKALRVAWSIGFVAQMVSASFIYKRLMFSLTTNISCAKPPFLLSIVGWFFLAVLGTISDIEGAWGLSLPSFCLGAGLVMYMMVKIEIFSGMHRNPQMKGAPALTLLLAPPSVGIVAMDLMRIADDDGPSSKKSFGAVSEAMLGFLLLLFYLLLRLGPKIAAEPGVLGMYWAYVFPISALATVTVRYANVMERMAAEVMAIFFVFLSTGAFTVVFIRDIIHCWKCITVENKRWGDPLVDKKAVAPDTTTLSTSKDDKEEEP